MLTDLQNCTLVKRKSFFFEISHSLTGQELLKKAYNHQISNIWVLGVWKMQNNCIYEQKSGFEKGLKMICFEKMKKHAALQAAN